MREGGLPRRGALCAWAAWLGGTLLQPQRAWRGRRAPHTAEGSEWGEWEGQRDGRPESAGSAGFEKVHKAHKDFVRHKVFVADFVPPFVRGAPCKTQAGRTRRGVAAGRLVAPHLPSEAEALPKCLAKKGATFAFG